VIQTDALRHTKKIEELLAEGELSRAAALHNAHLKEQFEKAKTGQVINLSDLMAAKEELDQAAMKSPETEQ
jgi:hypothetical protein